WARGRRVFDRRRIGRVFRTKRPTYEWFAANTTGGPAPRAATSTAAAITETAASLSGSVNPNGRSSTYYFEYGTTTSYGSTTATKRVRRRKSAVNVRAGLSGLSTGTTYHYRLYTRNGSGVACSSDRAFTTLPTPQQLAASRAVATYDAMQQYFYAPHVYHGDNSSLYTENYPQSGRRYSFLWPFSQAMAGTIALAGIPSGLVGGGSYQTDVADRLTGLSRYWGTNSSAPGYDSCPPAPYGAGGDKYYDDQA